MWKSFGTLGSVIDIYIPAKRVKNGKHFGFVRFKGVRDTVGLENRLKDMWIGERQIFIKLARFRRPNGPTATKPFGVAGTKELHGFRTGNPIDPRKESATWRY